jgi:ABC-type glycerol-3-phosphate transport system substrate-binding protein
VLVVDDAPLGAAIADEYKALTESELKIALASREQVLDARRLPADVVVFPSLLLGELVERELILPLSLEDEALDLRDVFPLTRLHEVTWGGRYFAAPLGAPQLVLVYRADLFRQLQLEPPRTWQDYAQACARLNVRAALGQSAPAADQPWNAAAEPVGKGWAGQLLLARSACYAASQDQVSPLFELADLTPLIDTPPYERALSELVQSVGGSSPAPQSPADALAELIIGRCAMALTWPTGIKPAGAEARPAEHVLAFAELPGDDDVYDFGRKQWMGRQAGESLHVPLVGVAGRLAAVTSTSPRAEAAAELVAWLSSAKATSRLARASGAMALFRASQEPAVELWCAGLRSEEARQYFAVARQAQSRPQRLMTIRLLGADRYLAALDEAVAAALSGENPAQALKDAAGKWQAITDQVGRARQLTALKRSLGVSAVQSAN